MEHRELQNLIKTERTLERVEAGLRPSVHYGDFDLINLLKGTWTSQCKGWNLIALPEPTAQFNYRLLMSQHSESLNFAIADRNIPNRGSVFDYDSLPHQLINGLSYEQLIHQVTAEDSPNTGLAAPSGAIIHHEPGFFLENLNHVSTEHTPESTEESKKLKVARLASIPHGNSVLAMGTVEQIYGPPTIPDLNALPRRVSQDVEGNPYLGPYKHFEDEKFFGTLSPLKQSESEFPGFFASNANAILQFAMKTIAPQVENTTILHFDTRFGNTLGSGAISNTPFISRQADATEMQATFWIMKMSANDSPLCTEFVMMYSQTIMLDFFPSRDKPGKLIRWPHISINTLRRA